MQVLVIDDNQLIRDLVAAIIDEVGHTALLASGAQETLEILADKHVDLILMDVEMPEINGFDLTRKIRTDMGSRWIPIIFLSAQTDTQHLVDGINAGGDDYLTKPVNAIVLQAKIKAMARISEMQHALDAANRRLKQLTQLDPLTGVLNRRGMEEELKRTWKLFQREQSPLCVLLFDIDYFKQYNDNYGHQQGDECLIAFCDIIKKQLKRPADTLARFGGEEFLVILPNTKTEGAFVIARSIVLALKKAQLPHSHSPHNGLVTASIGIASTQDNPKTALELIKLADEALYHAKSEGRNRIVSFQETLTPR
ncbi:diguanylate cyclase [Neptunomonas sp. XY-337]|uniref:GGDEF domain-containing protein n=1 Tax=Neptunomonas sp. XY-337 TaxID=2561897 RepID=UPI0010AAAC93|nr:diguanylate cyclase [Neptunomonas sp. XY-337]